MLASSSGTKCPVTRQVRRIEPRSEHGGDKGRIVDVLSGHPGVGRPHESSPVLTGEELSPPAAGGGGVHHHVSRDEPLFGPGEAQGIS